MLRYILAVASFTFYILLLGWVRVKYPYLAIKKSLLSFFYYIPFWVYVLLIVTATNFMFFEELFLEKDVWWIPVLRAPLVEESGKLFSIFILKRTLIVSGNEFLRLGGATGAWIFFTENISYIWARNVTARIMTFRLFPLHINSAILVTCALRDDLSKKKRGVLFILSIILHGVHNYLSITDFQLYVIFGFFSIGFFIIILLMTPVHEATPLDSLLALYRRFSLQRISRSPFNIVGKGGDS